MMSSTIDVKKTAFNVPHAQSSVFGSQVFLAGMVGTAPGTRDEALGFRAQARQALENLVAVAAADGMAPEDFTKCNVYLRDMNHYDVFNRLYTEYFGKDLPVTAVYEIPGLPGPFEIEIDGFGYQTGTKKRKIIRTGKAPQFPESAQGVLAGDILYVAPQMPARAEGNWPVEGYEAQIRQSLDNMLAVVEAAGGKKQDIIKVTIYLKDMLRFDEFNAVYREYFDRNDNPPARSCFGVTALPGPYHVAIECEAYLAPGARRLRSEDAPIFDLPFCQGVQAGEMVFVSGQVGYDQHTGTVPETFEGQTRQMMQNMMRVAKMAGATPDDFVKTQCFLTDIRYFDFFNRIYKEYFGKDFPARSTFAVNGLAYNYIVEIDGIACIKK